MLSMSRRTPRQARAEKRRESLLRAAAQLLERVGYEAVTTNAIAKEARASVGTLYEYFPNKEAIFVALLEDYRQRLAVVLSAAVANIESADLEEATGRCVRAFAHFYGTEPGYAELWLGSQLVGTLREAGAEWGNDFGAQFGLLLSAHFGVPPAAAPRLAQVLVHSVSAVVSLSVSKQGAEREKLVDEAVALAVAYLQNIMDRQR